MNFYTRRFNLYLLPVAALLLVAGCALFNRQPKGIATLRVHIESGANASSDTKTISVLRAAPVMVTIATDPILTEANILTAKLVESPGGFAVQIKFNESGSLALEQYSAINPGKHFAIFGQWGEPPTNHRWLAAPSINRFIASGTLTFTPDASRAETEELVKGWNIAAKNSAVKN